MSVVLAVLHVLSVSFFIITVCWLDARAYASAFFGEGHGPVLLDYVRCNGDEASLLNCKHANTTECDHSSDAGVDCLSEPF